MKEIIAVILLLWSMILIVYGIKKHPIRRRRHEKELLMALSQNVQDLTTACNGVVSAVNAAIPVLNSLVARLPNPEDQAAITQLTTNLINSTNELNTNVAAVPPAP